MPSDTLRRRYKSPEPHSDQPSNGDAATRGRPATPPRLPPLEQPGTSPSAPPAYGPPPTPPLHTSTASPGSAPPPRRAAAGSSQRTTPPWATSCLAGEQGSAAARRTPTFDALRRSTPRAAGTGATIASTAPATGLALRIKPRRNPRLLGALAYAVPFLPALALLVRERRNRFVRAHAAQALVFFAALALAQVALYALLVLAGGLTTSLRAAIAVAVALAVAWVGMAALAFVAWARLVAAALAGQVASLPLVTSLARVLLRRLDRVAAARRRARNDRRGA